MKRVLLITSLAILALVVTSCHYTDIVPDDGTDIVISEDLSFANDIEPIFKAQSCTNCHPGMKQPDLSAGNAYKGIVDGGFIDKKNAAESKILIKAAPEGSHAGKLTAAQVQQIIAWIEQGAKDN